MGAKDVKARDRVERLSIPDQPQGLVVDPEVVGGLSVRQKSVAAQQ